MGGKAVRGLRWGSDLLEPLANSTLMVLPSMVSGGCRACRICRSWAASYGWTEGSGPGRPPGSIAPFLDWDRVVGGVKDPPPYPGGRDRSCPAPPCAALTTMVESWMKAKPRFSCVCLSFITRTLEDDSTAYGARAPRMESMVLCGFRLRKIMAVGKGPVLGRTSHGLLRDPSCFYGQYLCFLFLLK